MDKQILKQWLKAGYLEKGRLLPTTAGTPQGEIVSPVLANLTLDGLEQAIKRVAKRGDKVNFVRYADDFIVTGATREILEESQTGPDRLPHSTRSATLRAKDGHHSHSEGLQLSGAHRSQIWGQTTDQAQ